jgi:hypothetical protein
MVISRWICGAAPVQVSAIGLKNQAFDSPNIAMQGLTHLNGLEVGVKGGDAK